MKLEKYIIYQQYEDSDRHILAVDEENKVWIKQRNEWEPIARSREWLWSRAFSIVELVESEVEIMSINI